MRVACSVIKQADLKMLWVQDTNVGTFLHRSEERCCENPRRIGCDATKQQLSIAQTRLAGHPQLVNTRQRSRRCELVPVSLGLIPDCCSLQRAPRTLAADAEQCRATKNTGSRCYSDGGSWVTTRTRARILYGDARYFPFSDRNESPGTSCSGLSQQSPWCLQTCMHQS